MKRKASEVESAAPNGVSSPSKKRASPGAHEKDTRSEFRQDLFDASTLRASEEAYAASQPYPHHVISSLIEPSLLKSVRSEITSSLSFTPKQTDIYRIHQTGDLANLSGLDSASLSQLPSLLRLRDALYSPLFRSYLSGITGSGPLSGVKTDMAINVYTPGCHLLCHDDVIGSRRVSYILYLTNPEPGKEWRAEWGGALRLYPTTPTATDGVRTPSPDASVKIPPAFNQLSFFAVRPGESFHDVEEVYHAQPGDEHGDEDRVRMAISGWYHVPQKGEDGYVPGVEEKWAEKSSLMQLQGKAAEGVDFPQRDVRLYTQEEAKVVDDKSKGKAVMRGADEEDDDTLSEADLTFLLRFLAPTFLTPETLSSLSSLFLDESSLRVDSFLSRKFAERLRADIEAQERESLPSTSPDIESTTPWRVARPPHKHRYLYQQIRNDTAAERGPLQELLEDLFPSRAFRKWLCLATSSQLESFNVLARRFRRGEDYTLASGSASEEEQARAGEDPSPTVEVTLGITPSTGWGDDEGQVEAEISDPNEKASNGQGATNGSSTALPTSNGAAPPAPDPEEQAQAYDDEDAVGGYEVYMASSDGPPKAKTGNDEDGSDSDLDPAVYRSSTKSKSKRQTKSGSLAKGEDKSGDEEEEADEDEEEDEDEDDGILFSMPPGWNRLSIVLRDAGVLRFVKYVSRRAKGDRWDITGEFTGKLLAAGEDEGEEEEDGEEDGEEDNREDEEEEGDEDEASDAEEDEG
ncbi:MAG: hypothetical protein M4579_001458 [Chaenotheca gracillima]|nr:MAG: hypothetical protein M4579_001458 [Chaenotheca gracillima]